MGLRFQLLEATSDLYHMALGPEDMGFMQPLFWNHDTMITDILNQFNFFSAVPLGGSANYGEIAGKTNLPESIVRRVIRHAMTMRLFEEKPPGSGSITHTSTTAFMARYPIWRSWLGHNFEDVRPGTVYVPESLSKFSAGRDKPSEDILNSGVALADVDHLGHPTSPWEYIDRTPEGKPDGYRANRFAEAMQILASTSAVKAPDLLAAFDWNSFGEATVIDVGGSAGHDALALAESFPALKFIVQDLQQNQSKFQSNLPPAMASRISYEVHNFFNPQPTTADVYFLKMILHDWPNKDACSILRNLVPSLRPGARILLCENVVPPAHDEHGNRTMPVMAQRMLSAADLQMLTAFNSMERNLDEWKALVKEADENLEIRSVFTVPGAFQSIIELVLKA
ncbi:S-adenosyl-L-methionine-dependent methyltransferase [Ilyonectria destructans]|nr:S-adenosyl-L-methionine-dependent methyltransferase [Ilyonectria destructans]